MSDFIPFKEFHKNTNLSYQQLLRTFHKTRKGNDSPLSEGEDYRYEGKDDVSGRTGILFVNSVLIFPKLKKQRIDLAYVESLGIPDKTTVVSHKTDMKSDESTQTKKNREGVVSSDFNAVQDETILKSDDTTLTIRTLTAQLEKKDEQIERKDGQIDNLTTTINGMETNRYELQKELAKANEIIHALKSGEVERSEDSGVEVVEVGAKHKQQSDTEANADDPLIIHEHDGEEDSQTPPDSTGGGFTLYRDSNPPSGETIPSEAKYGEEHNPTE